ncbi:hypothetical protein MHYP_G00217860 [Metynnis hypsauchen]
MIARLRMRSIAGGVIDLSDGWKSPLALENILNFPLAENAAASTGLPFLRAHFNEREGETEREILSISLCIKAANPGPIPPYTNAFIMVPQSVRVLASAPLALLFWLNLITAICLRLPHSLTVRLLSAHTPTHTPVTNRTYGGRGKGTTTQTQFAADRPNALRFTVDVQRCNKAAPLTVFQHDKHYSDQTNHTYIKSLTDLDPKERNSARPRIKFTGIRRQGLGPRVSRLPQFMCRKRNDEHMDITPLHPANHGPPLFGADCNNKKLPDQKPRSAPAVSPPPPAALFLAFSDILVPSNILGYRYIGSVSADLLVQRQSDPSHSTPWHIK